MMKTRFQFLAILILVFAAIGVRAQSKTDKCSQTMIFQTDDSHYISVSADNGLIRYLDGATEVVSQYQFLDYGATFVDMKIELSGSSVLKVTGNSKHFSIRYKGNEHTFFETFDCR